MKIVENRVIPFGRYKCINLFGVLFVKRGVTLSDTQIQHERIHTAQMKEMLYVVFYLWYVIEWFIRLFINGRYAYVNIAFEREAYACQEVDGYLDAREPYAWMAFYRSGGDDNQMDSTAKNPDPDVEKDTAGQPEADTNLDEDIDMAGEPDDD